MTLPFRKNTVRATAETGVKSSLRSRYAGLETAGFVRTVAERTFATLSATAKRDCGFALCVELVAVFVENLKLAFDAKRTVVFHNNFCSHDVMRLVGRLIER